MEPSPKHLKVDPQRIHLENIFIHDQAALHPDSCHLATQLHLEDVQIESELLISCIRRMENIQTIDLINITLFGSIYLEQHEKLNLPNLKHFRVHLNQLHDGTDNDDGPEILSGKVRTLLFFKPPAQLEQLDIQLKVLHEDGFWEEFFTTSSSATTVYSALDWNPELLQLVSLPNLRDLSLHNCGISGNDLVPVQSLTSLSLSAIQSNTRQFVQLLGLIAASTTLKNLTLRQYGSLKFENLLLTPGPNGLMSNLVELTLISTEIEEPTPVVGSTLENSAPFPHLQCLSLIDCNLSQEFTSVYKNYFKDVAAVRIQEFPISCELVYFILQHSAQTRALQIHKFNLDSCWEAESEPENQSYAFMKEFLIKQGIMVPAGSRARLSFELEKVGGTNWKCSWTKNTEPASELGDEFESRHRVTTSKRYTDVGVLAARDGETLSLELQQRQDNLLDYCSQLRILDLYGLDLDDANLTFLQSCSNLVVLTLENMRVNNLQNLSSSFLTQPTRPVLPKLQKYMLDLCIPAYMKMGEDNSTSKLTASDFIWFTKQEEYGRGRRLSGQPFSLLHIFSWSNLDIVIEMNHRTVFEMNWRTGLVNFGSDKNGSEILANPQFKPSFTLKEIVLHDLSHTIPPLLQPKLESLFIRSCDVEYANLTASITHCEQLKEVSLKDVTFVNVPTGGIEHKLLSSLEKVTFTKRGA